MSNAQDVRCSVTLGAVTGQAASWNIAMSPKLRTTLFLLLVASLLYACASTKLINSWRDPKYSGPPLTKVLVIGVTKQAVVRRTFEDAFAHELSGHGAAAVPSYTLIAEDGE